MKIGIYNSYWEHNWGGDCRPYIRKVKALGFDEFEVSVGNFATAPADYWRELGQIARDEDMLLTAGYGPAHDLASADPAEAQRAKDDMRRIFDVMDVAGMKLIGGGLYSYWPVDYGKPIDKAGDWARSVEAMKIVGADAASRGITLGMESLNRFEGYLINTADEAVAYVEQVGLPNVTVMLDTFHMNIEEDSMAGAILKAGAHLGHLHVGEANRRLPGQGRLPWAEMAAALRAIGYDGCVVMEPFVLEGGRIGSDIKVWRDLSGGASEAEMDRQAADSVTFLRGILRG